MENFKETGLSESVLKAVEKLGFETPTPIQAEAIPKILQTDADLIALAQTGTGKTAAFGLPIVNAVDTEDTRVQAIILSPTRELCLQIASDVKDFSTFRKGLSVTPVYGGASIETQIRQLKAGTQIVAGTPGRVCDMIRRKKLDLSQIKWVVLDEADEMLNMGFKEELDFILENTNQERRTLLFSATMAKEVQRIAENYMRSPEEIAVSARNTGAKNVTHVFYSVHPRDRYEALKRIADINPKIYGIVFCRTRRETKEVADRLMGDGYNADALHGDLSQAQRDIVMHRFRRKSLNILVATDVAARGIDVNDLTHVINYNLPDQLEAYIHRSGRTGRAGREGVSIVLLSRREMRKISFLEKKVGKSFEKGVLPSAAEITKTRLFHLIDRVKSVNVNPKVGEYIPEIAEKLEDFSKEDLITHIVSFEFNRLHAYYKNARDLNQGDSKKDERKRKSVKTFSRFYFNVGSKQNIGPKEIIKMINDHPVLSGVKLGDIEVFKKFTFVDIDSDFTDEVKSCFNGSEFDGHSITAEPVKNEANRVIPNKSKSSGFKKGGGGFRGKRKGGGFDKRKGGFKGGRKGRSFKKR